MWTGGLRIDSMAVHAGRDDLADLGVHALPIDLSTTNPLPDIERGGDSYEVMASGGQPPADGSAVYARLWNPTVARFESALATLERAPAAVAFSSGMAAMTAALLALTRDGLRHVVAVRPLYGGTDHLLASGLIGTSTTFCQQDEVAAAIRPDTALPSAGGCPPDAITSYEAPPRSMSGSGFVVDRSIGGACTPRPARSSRPA